MLTLNRSVLSNKMGNFFSSSTSKTFPPVGSGHTSRIVPGTVSHTSVKLPVPDDTILEERFTKVLASMDLPPDKARVLRQYDREKKWEMICDQERVTVQCAPCFYLNKLKVYIDQKNLKNKKRKLGDECSTKVLRDLEISLRTNHIQWVQEFLNSNNNGLDILVDYLSFRLRILRRKLNDRTSLDSNSSMCNGLSASCENLLSYTSQPPRAHTSHLSRASPFISWSLVRGSARSKAASAALSRDSQLRLRIDQDDVHVSIMCMRAIMNNKYGFNMVIEHQQAINCIALSLKHESLRTKALVLELLAAICLVKGGHQIILGAFDNMKLVCSENRRFQTLMFYFKHHSFFQIEFMVACMQFVNIVVHSVENMNFRVYLQYEFTHLGLDTYLDRLRRHESEELQVQINAYLDNVFDVGSLMEDSMVKAAYAKRLYVMDAEVSRLNEELTNCERERLRKVADLEMSLATLRDERDQLKQKTQLYTEEVNTLRRAVQLKDKECEQKQTDMQSRISELESRSHQLAPAGRHPEGASLGQQNSSYHSSFHVPAPPQLPGYIEQSGCVAGSTAVTADRLCAPLLPPIGLKSPVRAVVPPPLPPSQKIPALPLSSGLAIKRRVDTKYKLPSLNWTVMKPNQVRGTIFNDMDDEKLLEMIDFDEFEEQFKIGVHLRDIETGSGMTAVRLAANGASSGDVCDAFARKFRRTPERTTLLEHNRLRNLAILRRKLDRPLNELISLVNLLDTKTLSLELVEILKRMAPSEAEVKLYADYEASGKCLSDLMDEDQFLVTISKVDRFSVKLSVMAYMSEFFESMQSIEPQIHALIVASNSIMKSRKLHSVLEIILAFGNYMNSGRRGPAYGFRLQSLDSICDIKSSDRKISLIHSIVEACHTYRPEVCDFDTEFDYVERAAQISLENILLDIQELEKGMALCHRECYVRQNIKDENMKAPLASFIANAEAKLRCLIEESKSAQELFSRVTEFFGESTRSINTATFFAIFSRFVKMFKQAESDNEHRKKLDSRITACEASRIAKRNNKQSSAMVEELKNKTKTYNELGAQGVESNGGGAVLSHESRQLLDQQDVYHGALEDILLGLRSEPYRRADALRRSQRPIGQSERVHNT